MERIETTTSGARQYEKNRKWLWVGITVVLAAGTFAAGRAIWPSPVGALIPPDSLLPYFIGLAVLESILFGIGVAFWVLGFSLLNRAGQPKVLTVAAYVSIDWLLVNWWPHDNLHRVNPYGDFAGLLRIDLVFHTTLMVAAVIVAAFFWRAVSSRWGTTKTA